MSTTTNSVNAASGVSVVMPVLNEQAHLRSSVAAVLAQEFGGPLELILALGPSTDDTDQIAAELAALDSRVRLVANPSGKTPAGLNAAIAVARFPVIVRVDGHAELASDYVATAVETLARTGADNVGGVMAAVGKTDWEQAVAVAMTSRLGVGGAAFHVGGQEGEALTVYLGVFRAQTLRAIGGFDERFDRAQDWELNHRIRQGGGLVWFNPKLQVNYRPRPTMSALGRQYFQYGQWRREVMRRYPETVSLRYLAPPTLVAGLLGGAVLGAAGLASRSKRTAVLGLSVPVGYLAAVSVGALVISRGRPTAIRQRVPLAVVTMHISWGVGFLTSKRRIRD